MKTRTLFPNDFNIAQLSSVRTLSIEIYAYFHKPPLVNLTKLLMIFPKVANLKINAYGCQIEPFDPSQLFENLRNIEIKCNGEYF